MPSLLETLDGEDPVSQPLATDVIDAVKAAGARRRSSRRRRKLAGAVVALGLLAVPATALRSRGGDRDQPREVAVATNGLGTMSDLGPGSPSMPVIDPVPDPVPPTTLPPAPGPTSAVGAPPPTASARSAPPTTALAAAAPAATTTTARVCRNSIDPVCGEFRWDPPPAPNQPLIAEFTKKPAEAAVGQPVEFEVAWSDADAGLSYDRFSTNGIALATSCSLTPRFGPWTTPAAVGGGGKLPYTATFPELGEYRVIVTLGTASCASPYGNDTLVETLITVR